MAEITTTLRRQIAGTSRSIKCTLTLPCRIIPGDGIEWHAGWVTLQAKHVIVSAEGQCVDCGPLAEQNAQELVETGHWNE